MPPYKYSVKQLLLLTVYVAAGMVIVPILISVCFPDTAPTVETLGQETYQRAITGQRIAGAIAGLSCFLNRNAFKKLGSKK